MGPRSHSADLPWPLALTLEKSLLQWGRGVTPRIYKRRRRLHVRPGTLQWGRGVTPRIYSSLIIPCVVRISMAFFANLSCMVLREGIPSHTFFPFSPPHRQKIRIANPLGNSPSLQVRASSQRCPQTAPADTGAIQ
ncbi:protein of unknown function [Kyrpidia spormannii]|uniref:Uncharacterized protein n=1 Tax=Kyrpidia spormannii TaxID=2055160 RepID=A0ACA8ZCN7_9BACL|nr:protein of unknown function [Kyrpidia spormannii]